MDQFCSVIPFILCIFPASDIRFITHALHKQQTGKQKSNFNSNDKVKDDGQDKGQDENGNIALWRCLHKMDKGSPLAHVIGNLKQDSGNGRHGDQGCIGHQDNKDQKQSNGMYHTSYRCLATAFDIGCCSCDSTCCRNTSKEC